MKKNNSSFEDNAKNIKNIFAKPVIDIAKTITEKKESLETILKVVIPEEFVEQLKDGAVKLMKNKDGEILPNIVDENNKIVKQIRIEEIQEQLSFTNNIDKLCEYATEQKLDAMQEQLDYIVDLLEDIEKSHKNAKYGKVDGAIESIKQSLLEDDSLQQKTLQAVAQTNLNEGIQSLNKDIYDNIQFFKDWENRNFFEKNIISTKFTTRNMNRKLNNLLKDYYYMKKSRVALAELKLSQGMSWNKVQSIIDGLNSIDIELETIDIIGWLPDRSPATEWQYTLFDENKQDKQIVLEFNIKELLEEI